MASFSILRLIIFVLHLFTKYYFQAMILSLLLFNFPLFFFFPFTTLSSEPNLDCSYRQNLGETPTEIDADNNWLCVFIQMTPFSGSWHTFRKALGTLGLCYSHWLSLKKDLSACSSASILLILFLLNQFFLWKSTNVISVSTLFPVGSNVMTGLLFRAP